VLVLPRNALGRAGQPGVKAQELDKTRRYAVHVAHLASVLDMAGWAAELGCWKKLEDTGQRLCDTQNNYQRAFREDYHGLPQRWQRLVSIYT
jgi:hypothetical protein